MQPPTSHLPPHIGLDLKDLREGDVILTYTGWQNVLEETPGEFIGFATTPGINRDVVEDILIGYNIMLVGTDAWTPDSFGSGNTWAHRIFLPCAGGYIQEVLNLKEWVMDAREGDSPWIGAYFYNPVKLTGFTGNYTPHTNFNLNLKRIRGHRLSRGSSSDGVRPCERIQSVLFLNWTSCSYSPWWLGHPTHPSPGV